jgi:hypothetical protein
MPDDSSILTVDVDLSQWDPMIGLLWLRSERGFAEPYLQRTINNIIGADIMDHFRLEMGPGGPWAPLRPGTIYQRTHTQASRWTRMARAGKPLGGKLSARDFRRSRSPGATKLRRMGLHQAAQDFLKGRLSMGQAASMLYGTGGIKMLQDKGMFRNSLLPGAAAHGIRQATPYLIRYGTTVAYAGFLQRGTRRMIPRPVVWVSWDAGQRIVEVIRFWMVSPAAA